MTQHSIFWFRRDLRLEDNKGLYHALKEENNIIPLFIFDTDIIESLPENDPRVNFIYQNLSKMEEVLKKKGKHLVVHRGKPIEILQKLLKDYAIKSVYTNIDHEPYGIKRDNEIAGMLKEKGVEFKSSLDHLLFGKDEVLKGDGTPYNVFTPYGRKCKETLSPEHFKHYTSENLLQHFAELKDINFPGQKELAITNTEIDFPNTMVEDSLLEQYHRTRDYPAENGTSRIGVHLRFGTVSLRSLARRAIEKNDTYLNELFWREFYAMILWHYPDVVKDSFKPAYDKIPWRNNQEEFEKWKQGKTGYPIVDAGMRELSKTGYMHNRVRMITASFLTKHLLIDWRWGEAWFAEKLLDFELSSNNGGWQWSAGSGCDAAPYFRIFNPSEQQKKFDPKAIYIKKWVPEYGTDKYADPLVEHKFARERCLSTYKKALNG